MRAFYDKKFSNCICAGSKKFSVIYYNGLEVQKIRLSDTADQKIARLIDLGRSVWGDILLQNK